MAIPIFDENGKCDPDELKEFARTGFGGATTQPQEIDLGDRVAKTLIHEGDGGVAGYHAEHKSDGRIDAHVFARAVDVTEG